MRQGSFWTFVAGHLGENQDDCREAVENQGPVDISDRWPGSQGRPDPFAELRQKVKVPMCRNTESSEESKNPETGAREQFQFLNLGLDLFPERFYVRQRRFRFLSHRILHQPCHLCS